MGWGWEKREMEQRSIPLHLPKELELAAVMRYGISEDLQQ